MSASLKIPKHLAIIMDGNGRWAERRHHPRVFGHVRGASRVRDIVKESSQLGIKALTLYTFSTENWQRPESELKVLWKLLKRYLAKERDELNRQNVRLRVIGEIDRLGPDVREVLDPTINALSKNTGLQLTLALSYGSRREIMEGMKQFARDCVAKKESPESLDEAKVAGYLWTAQLGELSEVDLIIRTSGEQRISNYLLWQAAYAELVFTDVCWPDFSPIELRKAIEIYSLRDRRFGGIGARA